MHNHLENPYFFPEYTQRPTPPPPRPGSGDTVVFYDDPADQERYERERARQLKAYERIRQEEDPQERLQHQRPIALNREHARQLEAYECMRQEEDPQERLQRQRLVALNREHYVNPPKPDFKTVVESLPWLDQDTKYPDPGVHQLPDDPISFYQVLHNPSMVNEPPGLPISFPRLGGNSPPMPTPHMPPYMTEHFQLRARLVENRDKYIALMNATECFCAGEWTSQTMESMYNGIYPWRADNPYIETAAEFAIDSLGSEIRLKKVIRANGQVLGGCATIYWLTMEASNDKFYEAVVVVSPEHTERVLKYIRLAKYFPEIPAHLHNLLGPNY